MGSRLFVGNLNFVTTEMDLRSHFEQAGFEVKQVTIVTDRETGRPRGFGFVEVDGNDAARSAIDSLDGQELDGRPLRINEARERERGGGGGGGNRGGGGGRRRDY